MGFGFKRFTRNPWVGGPGAFGYSECVDAFDPVTDITGTLDSLWLGDTTVYSTGTTPSTDGNDVGEWAAAAGDNAINLSQATADAKPHWDQADPAFNNEPSVVTDGVDDYLQGTFAGDLDAARTVIAVAKVLDTTTNLLRLFAGLSASKQASASWVDGDWWMNGGTALQTDDAVDTAAAHLYEFKFAGASSSLTIDGVEVHTGDAGADALSGFTLGALHNGTFPANARYAAIGILSPAGSDLANLRSWSRAKFGTP